MNIKPLFRLFLIGLKGQQLDNKTASLMAIILEKKVLGGTDLNIFYITDKDKDTNGINGG